VHRMPAANPGIPLYSLAWCTAQGGLLGAAGAERAVQLIDPRRWRLLDKWNGATRQAIHHLSFLDINPNFACVSGLDSEVVCGCWGKPPPPVSVKPYTVAPVPAPENDPPAAAGGNAARGGGEGAFSFKGDSRWLGVAKAAGVDGLAGFAASGWVTYVKLVAADREEEVQV